MTHTPAPDQKTPVPFPEGFLWGASTAAHQIEGNNTDSDWWVKEHAAGTHIAEPSLDACDSYHRWSEDMDLLASSASPTTASPSSGPASSRSKATSPAPSSPTTGGWWRERSSAACARW